MKKVVMVLTNSFEPDIRVLKEATYLSQKNYSIEILCWDRTNNSLPEHELIHEKILIKRFKHRSVPGTGLKQIRPYLKYINSVRKYLKKANIDYLHCHDFDGLLSGYIAVGRKKRKLGFSIIYDAHEFELGRNTNFKRSKFYIKTIKFFEKFLTSKVDHFIFVSQYQQKKMSIIYNIDKNWILLRNIPPKWQLDFEKINNKRKELIQKFSSSSIQYIVMYHGILNYGRGIENIINSLVNIPKTGFVLLGRGSKDYLNHLNHVIKENRVESRVIFQEHVNYDEIWITVGASNLGLILTSEKYESEIMSLPNKLFENIQSLTPMVVSNFPAMGELIHSYEIGETVDPSDLNEIASKINYLLNDPKIIGEYKHNLLRAKNELSWDEEVKSMNIIY